MKKTLFGLVLAGVAYFFPGAVRAQEEEEEPDHDLVCEQQFQSLEGESVDRFSSRMPGKRLQDDSKEALWRIIEKHYAGNPLEEMLDSWRTITIREMVDWPDVEKEVDSAFAVLRPAYHKACLVEEFKKWRTRSWLNIQKEVYNTNIADLCEDENVGEECNRGLQEGIITKEDYDKTPLEVCPAAPRKENECYDLFIPAIKKKVLQIKGTSRIDDLRNVADEQGKRRPYILTPQVQETAENREGVVSWKQYFTGEDKHSSGRTKLRCVGDAVSSVVVKNERLGEKSEFRALVEVNDIAWGSGKLGYYTLVCVAYENDRFSLPYSATFQFDGLGKKNPREKFHSLQSLEALFSPAVQGRFRSENTLTIFSKESLRSYIAVHGFIQGGKETAGPGVLQAGEIFTGVGIAEVEKFRTSPVGFTIQVGYNSRIGDFAGEITLEGNELGGRDFQYQVRYKRGLLSSPHQQILEGSSEMLIGKLKPWGTQHRFDWGVFARAGGDGTSLPDFSFGPKIRVPLLSRYSTQADLRLGYAQERGRGEVAHSILQAISFKF